MARSMHPCPDQHSTISQVNTILVQAIYWCESDWGADGELVAPPGGALASCHLEWGSVMMEHCHCESHVVICGSELSDFLQFSASHIILKCADSPPAVRLGTAINAATRRALVWGSVTCTAVVTVVTSRSLGLSGVGGVPRVQVDPFECVTTHLASMPRVPGGRGALSAAPGVGVSDMHCHSHSCDVTRSGVRQRLRCAGSASRSIRIRDNPPGEYATSPMRGRPKRGSWCGGQ